MKFYLLFALVITVNTLKVYPDECETTLHPQGWEQCKGKETDLPEEICCFVIGKRAITMQDTTHWCTDIRREDIETPEKFEITKERIRNGTYWSDVNETFSLEYITCWDFSSKMNLSWLIFLIIIILLF